MNQRMRNRMAEMAIKVIESWRDGEDLDNMSIQYITERFPNVVKAQTEAWRTTSLCMYSLTGAYPIEDSSVGLPGHKGKLYDEGDHDE